MTIYAPNLISLALKVGTVTLESIVIPETVSQQSCVNIASAAVPIL